ncbi:helix-turn-helix domain-containing protein [Mycolicibacterium fluoranthenivorans]|nr:helix-turn-helix transcriptional regulator [Mycolicibacterium fluoranthenivorans]MCV7355448.1 helix-turn-helix transcriptional regulator [Mycolicibacterium fluoranthenivorans]
MNTTFAARLNKLFEAVYPPGRGPHTSHEVVKELRGEGIRISAPYLSQLRTGQRTNPSAEIMESIAQFFRISVDYFTDDRYFQKVDKELTWLLHMRNENVRLVTSRALGLSEMSLSEWIRYADTLRRQESTAAHEAVG